MAKAYRVDLTPESVEDRSEYVIIPDDWQIPGINDYDAHDIILCNHDGYYVADVSEVSVEEARRYNAYSIG